VVVVLTLSSSHLHCWHRGTCFLMVGPRSHDLKLFRGPHWNAITILILVLENIFCFVFSPLLPSTAFCRLSTAAAAKRRDLR
jgi:hypothetical protein